MSKSEPSEPGGLLLCVFAFGHEPGDGGCSVSLGPGTRRHLEKATVDPHLMSNVGEKEASLVISP